MPFQKGHKHGKGRPAGSKNKTQTIEEALALAGMSPHDIVLKMVEMINDKANENNFNAMKELLPYLYEKKKTDVNLQLDPEKNQIRVIIEDYSDK